MPAETLEIEDDPFTEGEDPAPQPTTPTEQADPAAPAKKTQSAALAEALSELTKTVKSQQQPQQPQQRQRTKEEEEEFWGVYNPEKADKEFFKKFGRFADDATPEQVQAFREMFAGMQQGLVRQSIIGARNIFMQELQKLREEFAPATEFMQKESAKAIRARFDESFPALSDKKYAKILKAVATELDAKEFDDEGAYFKALSEGATAAIREIDPTFDPEQQQQKPKPGTTPRLPRTSVGGTGGAGGGKPTSQPSKGGHDMWD